MWRILGLMGFLAACHTPVPVAVPQVPPIPSGQHEPTLAKIVHKGIAQSQTFTAKGDELSELYLMVGLDSATDGDLLVEIRDLSFTRRFGFGRIEGNHEPPGPARWQRVLWNVVPQVEPGREYALVLSAEHTARDAPWLIAATTFDAYLDGHLEWTQPQSLSRYHLWTYDIAFEMRFSNKRTIHLDLIPPPNSLLVVFQEQPPRNSIPFVAGRLPVFPCLNNICSDRTHLPLGTQSQRQRLARKHFRACRRLPERLLQKSHVEGVTCRDVCDAHGFDRCLGQYVQERRGYCRVTSRPSPCQTAFPPSPKFTSRRLCECASYPNTLEVEQDE